MKHWIKSKEKLSDQLSRMKTKRDAQTGPCPRIVLENYLSLVFASSANI